MRDDRLSAADLAGMLYLRRADWLPRYYPVGRMRAGVFYLGSADGDAGMSLPIPLNRLPRITDFAGGFSGDDLALLGRAIGVGDDMTAACREARAFLGIAAHTMVAAAARIEPRKPEEPEDNREVAQELWREAHPLCQCDTCTPGRLYLGHRGITRWPPGVYFHPRCRSPAGTGPAILAPVNCSRTVHVAGIWRIRITSAGGKIGRFGLGPAMGNCSRLYWPEGDELAIAEGVEDAIAFHELSGLPCWAALSTSFMPAVILPPRLQRVIIVQDTDEPDDRGRRAGQAAAQRLALRLQAEGRDVKIIAPVGAKDANDVLMRRAVG